MRIEEIHLNGFGKWENARFQFGTGINLIVARNEAGKSTLLEAMIALLYGLKKDYVKKAIKREEWQRYLPWSTQAYGGKITYCIAEQRYILERDLLSDEHRLYDAELLRDLSKEYPMDARKERSYVANHIGITRSLFEEITRIGMIGIDHQQQMVEWLHQQMGGNEEVAASYQDVFSLLEQKRREIGKGDTGKDTRLAQANNKLKIAKEQLDHATRGMSHLRQLEERSRELEAELRHIQSQADLALDSYIEVEQWQREREQALLSKQQMERYLQDIERLHVEEDVIWEQLGNELQHTGDARQHLLLFDRLQNERNKLEEDIEQCNENMSRLDEEITSYERLLPQLLEQQRDKEIRKAKKKRWQRVRVIAYITALLGAGMILSAPWYFGVGMWVIAVLLFMLSFLSTARPTPQMDLDYWSVQERLQQCQQEREELYRTRLQLERKGTLYREQEILHGQLRQIVIRKQELLQHIHVTREVDRRFVERWIVVSRSDRYNEELLIEDWVNRIKRIHEEIEQLTFMIEQHHHRYKEQEQLKRELAHLEGEMKSYQSISLEEMENRYDHALAEKEEWERKRGIIDLAGQLFRETIDEWNRIISPDLNKRASEIFSALTLGRYDHVRADPSDHFRLRVVESGHHAIREEAQLSRGTEQQLYLALRLALVDQYSKQQQLPIFLDDSFTHYDDKRLEQALRVLDQLSDKHQIFLFSCQSREEKMMDQLKMKYHIVPL